MAHRRLAHGWPLWLVGGLLASLGVVSLPSIGIFLLGGALLILLAAAAWARPRGMPLVLVGAAAPLLWVGWLHRGGPGQRCWQGGRTSGCTELLDPWPFVLAGLVLAAAGLVLLVAVRRPHP